MLHNEDILDKLLEEIKKDMLDIKTGNISIEDVKIDKCLERIDALECILKEKCPIFRKKKNK